MKKLSIQQRIILWFALAMIASSVATFFLTRTISETVMQKTLRSYLIGTVEANTDKLAYYPTALTGQEQKEDPDDIFISYQDGYLRIDDDFLDVMHNVESALYQSDGTMLYGKNPIARQTQDLAFSSSRIIQKKWEKETYFLYDRKLTGEGMDDLWIRGVVSMAEEQKELLEVEKIMFFFIPLLIVCAFLIGWMAARGILRPLREVQRTAAMISGGKDLKRRIPNSQRNDEIQKLTDTVNQMLDRLEESFEVEQQFSSDASHELRTPVSVILAQTELTLEKERDLLEYQKALQVIQRQGKRMQILVSEMLDYTRLHQRANEYTMEFLNFSQLTFEICEDMKLVPLKDITLSDTITADIWVLGNRLLLSRMLQNLIDNAFKYGKPHGHIQVSLTQSENIQLSISDDGIGISAENQKKIYQRFFRVDTARNSHYSPGYGLGLSMVEKIVQMHHAIIHVESKEGHGSTFRIQFPLYQKGEEI